MPTTNQRMIIVGAMMAACSAVLWGTAGTAQTFISATGPDPYWVGALRLSFSLCFFIPLIFLTPQKSLTTPCPGTLNSQVSMLLAALVMIVYNVCFFSGVKIIGVALGAAIIIGSSPIWAGILNLVFKKQMPKRMWLIGTLVAVFGGFLMAFARAQSIELTGIGLAVCLLAGLAYAFYAMIVQRVVLEQGSVRATGGIFLRAALLGAPLAYIMSGVPSISVTDLVVVGYLGVVTTGVAYWCFSEALKRINSATGVAMTLLEPVTAFVLSVTIVGEPGSWMSVGGLVAILFGLTLLLRSG